MLRVINLVTNMVTEGEIKMVMVKIDKRKQIVIDRECITALKNAVKDQCKYRKLSEDQILEMIHFYIGK